MLTESHMWEIISNYFKKYGFVNHQTESFDYFINQGISKILAEEPEIVIDQPDIKYTVSFSDVYIPKPTLTEEDRNLRTTIFPSECRQRDLTYDSPVYATVTEKTEIPDKQPEIKKHYRTVIARIPIMLRSNKCHLTDLSDEERVEAGECEHDHGGYFIIRGKERVLISQIRCMYNIPLVFQQKSGEKYKYISEVRSMSETTGHSVLIQSMIGSDDRTIVFSLPYIKEVIPVGIVFKALGYTTDEEITDIIGLKCEQTKKYIKLILRDSYFIQTQDEALKYMGQYAIHMIKENEYSNYAYQVVNCELFPHLGITSTKKDKAYFLGYILNKLLSTALGMRKEDDRDHFMNKRVECAGILCYDLFRQLFKRFTNTIYSTLEKKKHSYEVIPIISRLNLITMGMKSCFATGNWGVKKNNYIRVGVSQVLSRLSYGGSLSHLRRINIQIGKESKNSKIRQINPSQIMYICPFECFDPETPILLWDGSVKLGKDIVVGDILIDDNGQPTRVRSTCSGINNMYEITQEKGMSYTVTENHILTLKNIKNNEVIDIKLTDYLALPLNEKNELFGFKYQNDDYSSILINKKGIGKFVGWQVEGNGRFLLPDYTVVHNTPEGQSIGIVLNMAMLTRISEKVPSVIIQEIIEKSDNFIKFNDYDGPNELTKIFINGNICGVTENPIEFVDEMKLYRVNKLLPFDVSISYDENDEEIHILSDEGRLIRPLFKVKESEILTKIEDGFEWDTLVDKGYIEYVDNKEINNAVVAFEQKELKNYRNDYCEIAPSMMFGVMASLINFAEHSQAPRLCYQSSMGKQAMSMYSQAYQIRADTCVNVLNYPQKPLVSTKMSEIMGFHDMPYGINAIVAIMCYSG
jgi:DNA-directed RNA polymerase beta subunit